MSAFTISGWIVITSEEFAVLVCSGSTGTSVVTGLTTSGYLTSLVVGWTAVSTVTIEGVISCGTTELVCSVTVGVTTTGS